MVHKITGKTAPSIVTWTRNSLPIPDAFVQRSHWPRMWAAPPVTKRSESLHAESQGCQRNEMEETLASLLGGLKHLEFGFKGRNKNKAQTYQRQPIQHAAQLEDSQAFPPFRCAGSLGFLHGGSHFAWLLVVQPTFWASASVVRKRLVLGASSSSK